MSWYNTYSDSSRRLQQFIDNKPTPQQLIEYQEIIEILKSYNPKLLDYITASNELPKQMVRYLTQAPLESDSESRKYRLPMLTLMMIQTNTACVVNCFFKLEPNTQKSYFIFSFYEFLQSKQQLLPLLCGYFSQMNIVLWNNRYKQTIDLIYQHREPLFLLVNHTYNRSIVNTIMLYLNLDLTRNPNQLPQRTEIKLQIVKLLFDQIRAEFQTSKKEGRNQRSEIIIENVCDILIQIVEKYYLIADGKTMLQTVNSQQNIDLILQILMYGEEVSHSVVGLVLWLMRYYCLSSFNQEDKINIEHSKKNQERLEAQPFIKKITQLLPIVSQSMINCQNFTLYNSRLLDVFIPCLQLSSKKVGYIIKKSKFLQNLISLLFKFPQLSILHKQIQRAFFAIFCSQRKVCEQYRRYLFCNAGIIQMTAGEGLKRITKPNDISARLGWFGYLMKIVKVYSKIQTDDQQINNAIIQRSDLWEKFSNTLMKPSDAISFKDLGAYEGIIDKVPVQYTVRSVSGAFNALPAASKKLIEELIKEESSMQQFLTNMPQKIQQTKSTSSLAEDSLFMIQDFQKVNQNPQKNPPIINNNPNSTPPIKIQYIGTTSTLNEKTKPQQAFNSNSLNYNPIKQNIVIQQTKKEETKTNFQQFMNNRKQEIGHELNMQRKNSSQKRLSANKSRVTSPSPKKKRWDEVNNQPQSDQKPVAKIIPVTKSSEAEQKKQKISLTTPSVRLPSIPTQKSHTAAENKKQEHRNVDIITGPSEKTEQNIQSEEGRVKISLNHDSSDKQTTKSLQQSRTMSVSDLINNKSEGEIRLTKSAINFNHLKNMQFVRQRVLQPQKKQFRKIQNKDKMLLQFLGIRY